MSAPAQADLLVSRRVPFVDKLKFVGVDWTGSTLKMQVRQFKDTTGTALITLNSPAGMSLTYGGTATASAHITAGRLTVSIYEQVNPLTGVNYVAADSVLLSIITFGINAATIAAVPVPPISSNPLSEIGDDVVCWYDLIRNPSSGTDEIILEGKFTVRSGVTIP